MLMRNQRPTSPKNDQLKFLKRWQAVPETNDFAHSKPNYGFKRSERIIDAFMKSHAMNSRTVYNCDHDHRVKNNYNKPSILSPDILDDIIPIYRTSQLGVGDTKNEVQKNFPKLVNDKAHGSIIMKNKITQEKVSEQSEKPNTEIEEEKKSQVQQFFYAIKPVQKSYELKRGSSYHEEFKRRRMELMRLKKMKERIYVCGKGITEAKVNQWNSFVIIVDGIQSGKLSVGIEGPNKALIKLKTISAGQYEVQYQVNNPGFYVCTLKINNEPINMSPVLMIVKPEVIKSTKPLIFNLLESIGVDFEPINNKAVKVIATLMMSHFKKRKQDKFKAYCKGAKDPCQEVMCNYDSKEKIIHVTFMAYKSGKYEISITMKQPNVEKEIPMLHNPLPIWVHSNSAGVSQSNRNKIKSVCCYGIGLSYAFIDRINYVFIERTDGDYTKMSLKLQGPSHPNIFKKFTNNGLFFSYRPSIAGVYKLRIYYGDKEVIGSPFMIRVFKNQAESIDSPLTTSKFLCYGLGLIDPKLDEWNHFQIQILKYPWKLDNVEIHSEDALIEHVRLTQLKPSVYMISFFPIDKGTYMIVLLYPNKTEEIAPFHINII